VVAALRGKRTPNAKAEFYARTAERYTDVFGSSKGALMKAGQAMSFVSLGPAIPVEFQTAWRAALGRLRADAPPMAPELAREVLAQELGQRAEQAFVEFDWEPLAAASIGQVHAARLADGRRVAVKLQYPGVAAAIRADLKNHELLATFLGLLLGISPYRMRVSHRAIARELGARITEELDYELEATNQAEFARLYRGHPFIHVPEVVGELSTARVLTQELVQGAGWEEALGAEQGLRDSWGEVIYRFAYGSVQRFGLMNGDPHPGNYLFHDDGSVSFLDFGCVKRLSKPLVDRNTAIMRACLRGNMSETWRAAVEAGVWDPSDAVTPAEAFAFWRDAFRFWWDEQPFTITPDYAAAFIERRYLPTGPSSNALRHARVPPADYALLSRMDIGAISVLGDLRATNSWGSIVAGYLESTPPTTEIGKAEQTWLSGSAVTADAWS
jgi:predicted unusual protein kinase regulating ubiquinone biosynthesis (AarF/ABC1/UbiB family)